MKISSKLHFQPGGTQFCVLDVQTNDKPFFAGILIGDLRADPPTSTAISNKCLERLISAQTQCANNDEVMVIELRSPERVKERIPQVCEVISKHGAAAFYCIDTATYDAVFETLNIKK